jgi:hypothetical protein
MWFTLLVMAAAVSLEPFRVGMTILMINRPQPLLHLLAFLCGGFAMGLSVGVLVLFVLRPALGSAHFTLPRVQIVVGAIVLANAALVASGWLKRRHGDGVVKRVEPAAARIRHLVESRSLWAAGIAGLGIALPSVDYLAALALIVASGATAAMQFGALVLFNVVAFALVELPLVCYAVAPDRTRTALARLHEWLRSRGRREIAALLAIVGGVLVAVGVAGL